MDLTKGARRRATGVSEREPHRVRAARLGSLLQSAAKRGRRGSRRLMPPSDFVVACRVPEQDAMHGSADSRAADQPSWHAHGPGALLDVAQRAVVFESRHERRGGRRDLADLLAAGCGHCQSLADLAHTAAQPCGLDTGFSQGLLRPALRLSTVRHRDHLWVFGAPVPMQGVVVAWLRQWLSTERSTSRPRGLDAVPPGPPLLGHRDQLQLGGRLDARRYRAVPSRVGWATQQSRAGLARDNE